MKSGLRGACVWGLLLGAIVCGLAADAPAEKPILRYGAPEANYLERGDYLLAWDGRTRCPRWVLERLTVETVNGPLTRGELNFLPDKCAPVEFRPANDDYRGFSRGHLAAAANHSDTSAHMRATFTLANVVPQPQGFNGGIWLRLENHVRALAREDGVEVFCVTVPLWLPDERGVVTYRVIGKRGVAVPTHCGKAVLVQRGKDVWLDAWIIPNDAGREDFDLYRVTTDEFEAAAGLDLWPAASPQIERMEATKIDATDPHGGGAN